MTEQSKKVVRKVKKRISADAIRKIRPVRQALYSIGISIACLILSIIFNESVPFTILSGIIGFTFPYTAIHVFISQLRDDRIAELEKEVKEKNQQISMQLDAKQDVLLKKRDDHIRMLEEEQDTLIKQRDDYIKRLEEEIEEKTALISEQIEKEVERISTYTQTYTGNIKKDGKDSITALIKHLAIISYSQCTHCFSCDHVKDCQNLLLRYLQVDCNKLCEAINSVDEGRYILNTNNKDVHDIAVEHWLASVPTGNGEYLVVHFLDPTAKREQRNDYDEADEYFFRSVVDHLLKNGDYSKLSVKWLFIGDIVEDYRYCYDYLPRIFWEQQAYLLDNGLDNERSMISDRELKLHDIFSFKHIPKVSFDRIVPEGQENRKIYNKYIKREYPNIGIFGSNCVFVDIRSDKGMEYGCVFCNNEVQTLAKLFNSLLWESVVAKVVNWEFIKEKFKQQIAENKTSRLRGVNK